MAEHGQFDFPELSTVLSKLREQTGTLGELSPILAELAELPESFSHALRHAPVPLDEFEAAMGHKSVNSVYREDRAVNRFVKQFAEQFCDEAGNILWEQLVAYNSGKPS